MLLCSAYASVPLSASAQTGTKATLPNSIAAAAGNGADIHYYGLFKQYHIINPAQPQGTDPAVLAGIEALKAQNAAILQGMQAQQFQQQLNQHLQGLKAPTSPQVLYVPPTLGAPSYSPPVLGAPSYAPPVLGAAELRHQVLGPPTYQPMPLGAPSYSPPVYMPIPAPAAAPKPPAAAPYVPPTLAAPKTTRVTHVLSKPMR